MKLAGFIIALAAGIGLAGCGGSGSGGNVSPTVAGLGSAPPAYKVETFVGRWGIASYRVDKDRARTEAQARAACKLPYVITKGPTDGVMMYVADDPTLYELTLKGATNGKTYLGFASPPGDPQDREILSFSDNLIVMRFVDPDANTRYGTYIFVRCP